jgi:hypothetical protein
MTGLAVSVLFAACVALGWPAAAAAGDFKFGPASGGTKTRFTVQFTAPLSESGTPTDPMNFYTVDISGPAGCREAHAYTGSTVTAGQHVTIPVDPSGIFPFFVARQWCIGRYHGSVSYCYCDPSNPNTPPDVPIGRFDYRIHGPAHYIGTTKQNKGIRFTVSATGGRITGLRSAVRFSCRGGGRPSATGFSPLRQGPRDAITFRNGTFRARRSATVHGVRSSFEITGSVAGGTFSGKLRLRGSAQGVRCDSGPVKWSAV